MNTTKAFYSHNPNNKIRIEKDKAEINTWADNLEYINEELHYLIEIGDHTLHSESADLYRKLHTLRRENQLRLGALNRYDRTLTNAMECDTTECDAYYLHNHEKNRDMYLNHIREYRRIKTKLLSKIVLETKK